MDLYKWQGAEEELDCCCVATELTIEIFEERKGRMYAEGKITAKDYVEGGIVFTDPWEAISDESLSWLVKKKQGVDSFWKDRLTGEDIFTANGAVNEAMKKFIASKISEYLVTGQTAVKPQKFSGPLENYEGRCLCAQLKARCNQKPFPWEKMTNSGKFPKNCFSCSCGKNWWCYNSEKRLWARVDDQKAWQMLLSYNGIPVQKLGYLEGAFYLLQTLRDKGYIPMG